MTYPLHPRSLPSHRLAIALASVAAALGLAACTGSSPSSIAAADVSYDNTDSHLLSTDVQGAVDDVAAQAAAVAEDLDQIRDQVGVPGPAGPTGPQGPQGSGR